MAPASQEAATSVCAPNNDILTIPVQPEGVSVDDSGWIENEGTVTFVPAAGYLFQSDTQTTLVSEDEHVACSVDTIGTTVTIQFATTDGGSIVGASYALCVPLVSQAIGADPYLEVVIGEGNQIIIEEIIASTYRLVTSPTGYESIDATLDVTADGPSEEITIQVIALQVAPTATPVPTVAPTESADPAPAQTLAPAPTSGAVTCLLSTGSGPDSSTMFMLLAAMVAEIGLAALGSGHYKAT